MSGGVSGGVSGADRLADHLRQMSEGSRDAMDFTDGMDRAGFLSDLRTRSIRVRTRSW